MSDAREAFVRGYPFPLDRFQTDAFDALDRGEHVVVAAPTGSGKTVVAEYGIHGALTAGKRSFYTAPIKALSNQKFRDLGERYGDATVGLLTGDNSINGDAPVVVMTTEVLRNMIYGRSRQLADLGLVVLDEVHFLQDAYRGPVWEEVIIHLPQHVQLVCLSATVSNVDELAEWITTARGPTSAVVERRRPVQLDSEYLVSDRTNDRLRMLPVFTGGRANREALQLDESAVRGGFRGRRSGRDNREQTRGAARRVLAPPSRVETVELLARRQLLPAIYFIFSRAQCDAAAAACVDAGLDLNDVDERIGVQTILDERLGALDAADLDVLGYEQFTRQLLAGVAAHHAGMVPPMKEVVEACFTEGLVKVVFATETLAVGINMPARSVVIEKLTKFTGERHERLTPGEFTQLTGRAGRRGIDERGTAVVLWSPWVRFDEVAELAGSTSFHLRSAFHPTYNMAANLVRTYTSDEAHHLLNLSFAQFQADRDVVRLEARLERRRRAAGELWESAASDYGDIAGYVTLRDNERMADESERDGRRTALEAALGDLRPGAVIGVNKGTERGPGAVVAKADRKTGVRLTVVMPSSKLLHLAADDFDAAPQVLGSIPMPSVYAPNRREYRRDVARRIRSASLERPRRRRSAGNVGPSADEHPVAADPDLRAKVAAAGQARRIEREIADLERRVSNKNNSLATQFDRVLDVLERFGYLDRQHWTLTPSGEMLARVFHESDLLVTEVVHSGALDGLGAPDLAALVATIVYEHRSPDAPPAAWFSSTDVRARWRQIEAISEDLAATERSRGLPEHRRPDPTFSAVAHAWVAGEGFAEVVGEEQDLTGGDFVRTMKQLVDLLRQLALIAPDATTRATAEQAARSAFRGVVADSAAAAPTTESGGEGTP